MYIDDVTKEEYAQFIQHDFIFNSIEFNELNKYKVEELKYLLFKDNKYRFGLCAGVLEDEVLCPFSAPFASINTVKKSASIISYDDALEALDQFMIEKNYKSIRFILPPLFYAETSLSIFINALYRKVYEIKNIDLNYQFNLKKVCTSAYLETLPRNGRKNLRIGLDSGLVLKHCETDEEARKAYDIIAENRKSKGYPLHMTFQQVMDTVRIVEHDFFLVMKGDEPIASALIYYIDKNVAQVIYWGDRPGFGECKPINFLAHELIHYYGSRGLDYLDIGPSTEDSIPNYGLCDFKESIGCDVSPKITLIKKFRY